MPFVWSQPQPPINCSQRFQAHLGFGMPIPEGVPLGGHPVAVPQPAFVVGANLGHLHTSPAQQRPPLTQAPPTPDGAEFARWSHGNRPSYQAPQIQPQGSSDPTETKRKDLYSISYFPSSNSVTQNAQTQKTPSNTSRIFHEYRSTFQGDKVSPADFITNYYGNVDSNSSVPSLVKICKMVLAQPIQIGTCKIDGERNYIDINEGGNKTRIHIDNEGARDLENYRVLVRESIEKHRNKIDLRFIDQDSFKGFKNVADIDNFFSNSGFQNSGLQNTNDDKTLDAFVDTFISNHLKAGRFYTETIENGIPNKKPFAYVKIERPISNDKEINVTFSDKHSAQLNSININAGKNDKDEEVFFQLSLEEKDGKQAIAKNGKPNQDLKFFTKNKDGTFKEEKMEVGGWFRGFKNIHELGDAKDKIINIFTHKEEDDQPTLKYKIKGGKFDKKLLGFDTKDSPVPNVHKNQKVKCGEPNYFNDHEFMNAQSQSATHQATAQEGLQSQVTAQEGLRSPGQVPGGGTAVGPLVASSPMPMPGQMPMGGGVSVQMQRQLPGAWYSDAYQQPLMEQPPAPGIPIVSLGDLRSPTRGEVAGGADPSYPIWQPLQLRASPAVVIIDTGRMVAARPGGGGVAQDPVYMGGVHPMMDGGIVPHVPAPAPMPVYAGGWHPITTINHR